MAELSYVRETRETVPDAVARLRSELSRRGFGVLTELPVHEILLEKIGAAIAPVVILEVCSPRHAQEALRIARDAALLLPCKVVVRSDCERTEIALQRPTTVLGALLHEPALEPMGREVERLLTEAVDAAALPPG